MGLISKVIGGLFNGVSQQAADIRLDTQCELQENGICSLVKGLGKRPPTEFVVELNNIVNTTNNFVHTIIRDENEKYIMVIDDSSTPIKVYKLDGTQCTVNIAPGTAGYLSSSALRKDIKALTIADYTFIVNTTKTIQHTDDVSGPDNYEYSAIVHVAKGVQQTKYQIYLNDTKYAEYTTGDSNNVATYQTDNIAAQLKAQLDANVPDLYSTEIIGSTLRITSLSHGAFSLRVEDSWGNQAIYGSKKGIQSFTNLPPHCWDGTVLEIAGDDRNDLSKYYVKYDTGDSNDKTGTWVETIKPNLYTTLDKTTMPHALKRTGVDEFTFDVLDWEQREVGDDDSAPMPSFVGNTISEIFMYRNRLGFLSGENVILSQVSEFFNFFPQTIMDILDDDPIDVAVSTDEVNILRHAVSYNENLLLFSERAQFILSAGDNLLTPSTAALDTTTRFETSPDCKPVGVGPNVYFTVPGTNHTTIREYFVQPDSLVNDAANVTAHVPEYLPPNIKKLTASTNLDILFALSEDEPNAIYVYQFHWSGDEKAQSAWHKWIFDYIILDINTIDSYLFLLVTHNNHTYIEKINLELSAYENQPFIIHLDHKVELQGVYDSNYDLTKWTVPYSMSGWDATKWKAVKPDDGTELVNIFYTGGNIFALEGNHTANTYLLGSNYDMKYRFTKWALRSNENVAVLHGSLQVRTLTLSFLDTGYFKLQITPESRDTLEYIYTGVTVNENYIGVPVLRTDKKRYLVMANSEHTAIDIINDDYLPCYFQAAAWEGFMINRARLI